MIGQVQGEEPSLAAFQPYGTYTGPTVAGFTDPQNTAFGMTTADATGGGSAVPEANAALYPYLNGEYLSSGNPYFGDFENSVAQSVLPQLDSQWESAGRFSGNEEAPQAIAKGLASAVAPEEFQNYQSGLTNDLTAANSAAGLDSAQYIDPTQLLGIGGTQQQYLQDLINQGIYAGTYTQQQPEQALQTTLSQLLGLGGAGSTGYSVTDSNPSLLSEIMGGTSMGMGALSMLPLLMM